MSNRTCSYPECGREHYAKGYCSGHYRQSKRGVPLAELMAVAPRGSTLEERILFRTNKTDSCWIWTGARKPGGYGIIDGGSDTKIVHRVAYELWVGEIPPNTDIDHTCFDRSCVNPDHLRPVTRKQNMEHLNGAYSSSKTGVRGVYFHSDRGKYVARVTHNGEIHRLGYFESLAEADAAVRAKRAQLFTHDDAEY